MISVPIVFDIDGVLADTKDLVHEAYRRCGVTVPPGAWGKPWTDWLPDMCKTYENAQKIHDMKTAMYLEMLDRVKPLPMCDVAKELVEVAPHYVLFITSARKTTAQGILEHLGLPVGHLLGAEFNTYEKMMHLKITSSAGVYVDDNLEAGAQVVAPLENWTLIAYDGGDYNVLDILSFANEAQQRTET
jgi:hypothetical protein